MECFTMNLSVLSAFVDVVDTFTIQLKMTFSKFTLAQSCANLSTTYFLLQYYFLLSLKTSITYQLIISCGRDFFLENMLFRMLS